MNVSIININQNPLGLTHSQENSHLSKQINDKPPGLSPFILSSDTVTFGARAVPPAHTGLAKKVTSVSVQLLGLMSLAFASHFVYKTNFTQSALNPWVAVGRFLSGSGEPLYGDLNKYDTKGMEHSIGFPKLPEIAKEMRAKGETTRRVEKSFGFYSQGVDYWSLGSISLRLEGDLELNPKDPSGKWTFRGTIEMKEPENELYDMNMDASSVENRDPLANSIIFIFKQLQELGCCKDFNMYINGKKEIILTQDDYPEEGGISSTQKKFKKKEQPRIARHEDDLLDGHPIDKRFKKSRNDGPYPGKAELNQNNTKNSTNKAVIANQRNGRRRVS